MIKLEGNTLRLVLRTGADLRSHTVGVHHSQDDALSHWGPRDRISPIFPINGATIPDFSKAEATFLTFLGPVHPADVDLNQVGGAFLTLGIFNLLIPTTDENQVANAIATAEAAGICWETWAVDSRGALGAVFSGGHRNGAQLLGTAARLQIGAHEKHLLGSAAEYRVEAANALARSATFAPQLHEELKRFDTVLRSAVATEVHDVVKLGTVVIANAALSRHTSQTYSGASPIVESECYVASHGLLGIGAASMALARTRRFVERVFAKSALDERLLSLKYVSPVREELRKLPSEHALWDTDNLFDYGDPDSASKPSTLAADARWTRPGLSRAETVTGANDPLPESPPDLLPLLTFFSPRDGFRTTNLSLSAPLEVLSACNTPAWTLMTLTHEISHTLVDGILEVLLPDFDDQTAMDNVIRAMNGKIVATSLFDELQLFLMHGLVSVLTARHDASFDAVSLVESLRNVHADVTEILTHVFDFLYFYRKESGKYISAIWASWAVIPNIHHRIPDYILRSLCALAVENLRKDSRCEITVDQLVRDLTEAETKFPNALYIHEAKADLAARRKWYIGELSRCLPLVRFISAFCYSPEIATPLNREVADVKDELYDDSVVSHRPATLGFASGVIGNPLRFIEDFSNDAVADTQKSAWILTMLAFESRAFDDLSDRVGSSTEVAA